MLYTITEDKRFCGSHLLADTINRQLCNSKVVKGPTELHKLGDLALNTDLILKETSLYAEVDSQTTISTITDRLAQPNKMEKKHTSMGKPWFLLK